MIRRGLLVFLATLMSVSTLLAVAPQAAASGRPLGISYFLNSSVTASTHRNVLQGGLAGVTTKAQFIKKIKDIYNTSSQYGACVSTSSPSCDFAGARYIIQTMRGKADAGNWDYGFPDAADVADWEARINSDAVEMRIGSEGAWAGGITTARYRFGSGGTQQYDIAKKAQAVGGQTITFFNVNTGQIYYMLEVVCANPVGTDYGLPSPVNFTLTPTMTVTPSTAEGASGNGTATGIVNNGGSTSSSSAAWQVTTFKVAPGATVPAGGRNSTTPVSHYGHSASVVTSGNTAFPRGNTNPTSTPVSFTIPDDPVGTKICYTLSVRPYSHTDASWMHSAPGCVTISKLPKVQVQGSDLFVGRGSAYNSAAVSNVNTSQTTKSGLTYGSWAEYAIVPSGTVTGMASGSAYVGGAPTSALCSLSVLTFTKTSGATNCGTIGNYTRATLAPNVSARFPINVRAANVRPGFVADPAVMPTASLAVPNASVNLAGNNLSGHYQVPAGVTNLTISGNSTIPKGRWIVINAPETNVTITGNITYTTDSMSSLSEIPQVVIIARNIIIADNVGQIDSWLVTTGSGVDGRVNTCGAGGVTEVNPLVYTQCNNKLTVNGPVIANHLVLRRTFGAGSGAASGEPAEVFNLRADAYLWATNYNQQGGRIPTVSTKELPPRF